MVSGPRRRTLRELLEVCGDTQLFAPLADGRAILTAQRQDLERALGISRGTLYRRIDVLTKSGLATDDGSLVVDVDAISQRVNPEVVALPTERTRRYQELLEQRFESSVAADGTPVFAHANGDRATLADMAEVMGTQSRGTAQRHLDRLRNATATSPEPAPRPSRSDVDDPVAFALDRGMASVSSLNRLYTSALHSGWYDLAAAAATSAEEITTAIEHTITGCDAAFAARTNPRHDAALRAPERGANAAYAPAASFENEVEIDSSHPQDAHVRAANRDANAASTADQPRAEPVGVPPDQRDLGEIDWSLEDWPALVAPLHAAWPADTNGELRIDSPCLEACQAWPRLYIQRAIQWLADDVARGYDPKNSKQPIRNPGGLLVKAAREGLVRYFPLEAPTEDIDPEARQRRRYDQCRQGALDGLAQGLEPFSLAHRVLQLAETKGQPDLDAVELMLGALHEAIDCPDQRHQFDTELIGLTETQVVWKGTTRQVEAMTSGAHV